MAEETHTNLSQVGQLLRAELRKLVDPPDKGPEYALRRLSELSDTELADLFVKLVKKGRDVYETARWFKYTKKKFKGVSLAHVEKLFDQFRVDASPVIPRLKALAKEYGAKGLEASVKEVSADVKKLHDRVGVLKMMYHQVQEEKIRLDAIMGREAKSKHMVLVAQEALDSFMDHCKTIAELETKLGLRDQAPAEVDVRIHGVFQHYQKVAGRVGVPRLVEATQGLIGFIKSQEDGEIDCTPVFNAEVVNDGR